MLELSNWMKTCGCPRPAIHWSSDFDARICQNCGVILGEEEELIPFVHLRVHTHLSMLRAVCKTEDIINKTKEFGMPAVAKTEYGNMYGTPTFIKACNDNNIKPIIGTEFNVKFNDTIVPVTFIALNHIGYKNLVKLNTIAWDNKGKDKIDPFLLIDNITEYGLVALIECISTPDFMRPIVSELNKRIETFLEVICRNNSGDINIDSAQCVAQSLNLKIVATNNVHYTNSDDVPIYKIALKIANKENPLSSDEHYFKSPKEMFDSRLNLEWLENSVLISNRVEDYKILNKNFIIPTYKDKNGEWGIDQAHSKLEINAWSGLAAKGLINNQQYVDRLNYELSVMKNKKFSSYFLIINDIVDHIKEKGDLRPIGRGCLSGDALVLTSGRGYIPLKDVNIDDKVVTHTGKIKDVLSVYEYDINESCIEIRSSYSNNNIQLTTDHKVYAYKRLKKTYRRGKDRLKEELEGATPRWIKANDLCIGDYIYTPFLISRRVITQPIRYDLSKYIPHNKSCIFNVGDDIITQYIYNLSTNSERSIYRNTGRSRSYLRVHRDHSITDTASNIELSRYIEVDTEFAYFLGRWIGDGWITNPNSNKKMIGIAFNEAEIDDYTRIYKYLTNIGFHVKVIKNKRHCVQLLIYNILFYNLLHNMFPNYAYTSNTKSLGYIKYWPNSLLKQVLLGLKDSDGHYECKGKNIERECIDTTSHQLMLDIQEALLYLRIPSYVQTRSSKRINWNISYKIRFHGLTTPIKAPEVTSNGYYSRITSIKTICLDKVYDISVADDKSYLVRSGAVHNSSVGSLVCYCLDITAKDPIKWGVPFERFINAGRVDLPDIDTDITQAGRDDVLKYIVKVHGYNNVAQIATFQTMALKASIDNVGRALGIPFIQNKELRNKIPDEAETLDDIPIEIKDEMSKVEGWTEYAVKMDGLVKNTGYHAAGVVISNSPLGDLVPIINSEDGILGIQYDMKDIELLGLLKLDMLGLKNLDIIQNTVGRIKKRHNIDIDIYNLPDDKNTYDLISSGDYVSLFQLDSTGYRRLCKQLRPDNFEHIMALNALFRPGPLEGGMTNEYVERRHGRAEIIGWHPWLNDELDKTYQVPVYQEQVMAIAKIIAGFDDMEADKYRKAIGKKNKEQFDAAQNKFKERALKRTDLTPPPEFNGSLAEWIDKLLHDLAGYARYGWNQGHSLGYGYITYITAYLETHYKYEYYAALLDAADKPNKIATLIRNMLFHSIKIQPPHINQSGSSYEVGDDNILYMGLSAVKGCNKVVDIILEERNKNGKFASFIEFCQRLPSINKTVKVALIKAGAFSWDTIITDRNKLDNIDVISKIIRKKNKNFDGTKIPSVQILLECFIDGVEFTDIQKQQNEKDSLNSFITGHPASIYQRLYPYLERGDTKILCPSLLNSCVPGESVLVIGMIDSIKRKLITKEGANFNKPYLSIAISDGAASILMNVWYPLCDELLNKLTEKHVAMFECITRKDKFREGELSLQVNNAIMINNGLPIQGIFTNNIDSNIIMNKLGGVVESTIDIGNRTYTSIRGGRIMVMPDILDNIINEHDVRFLLSLDV